MKTKTPQKELAWSDPGPFRLKVEQITDGDRLTQEAARRESDKQESDKLQTELV